MATTPALITYLQGLTPITTVPDGLSLDNGLWQAMNTLWQRSVAHLSEGIVVEWGGVLELWRGRLRLSNLTSGTAEGLQLIVPPDSRFVGSCSVTNGKNANKFEGWRMAQSNERII
jgi:hypothetical protein